MVTAGQNAADRLGHARTDVLVGETRFGPVTARTTTTGVTATVSVTAPPIVTAAPTVVSAPALPAPAGTVDQPLESGWGSVGARAARAVWRVRYRAALVASDLLVAGAATSAAVVLDRSHAVRPASGTAIGLGAIVALAWIAAVALARGYDPKFLAAGTQEYRRVGRAAIFLAVVMSFAALASQNELLRTAALFVPAVLLLEACAARWLARLWVDKMRTGGRARTPVLVIGTPGSVEAFSASSRAHRTAAFHVVGSCGAPDPVTEGAPDVLAAVRRCGARAVVVTSDDARWLVPIARQLEGSCIPLQVALDTAGIERTRLHLDRIGDIPLMHVDVPCFSGPKHVLKAAFDRVSALLLLLVLAPVFLAVAAAVRLTSRGPVFFRQQRVGRDQRPFTMLKFRSMHLGAEHRVAELAPQNAMSDGPMFKVRNDPRVTRVGRFLRQTSLDELPQLVNVLLGSMSLVGPRPPLPAEVERYTPAEKRRLLVKPGITGLWQVSGRCDLSWEDTVRLDLRYVENWSIVTDLVILARTVLTVVRGAGAY
jgi:exopolysaccharide biosynthesis polyprenyl glycosylphosphotransferase